MSKLASMSRRRFAQLMGVGAASVVAQPNVVLSNEPLSKSFGVRSSAAATVVRLNSNENPYGPSVHALKAMTEAFELVWRYPDEHADTLLETIAKINGVNRDQIILGDGSGEILKICASAFTGPATGSRIPIELSKPTRGPALTFVPGRGTLVVADPTYEAIVNHARVNRASVVKIPLNKNFGHDLPRMLSAAREGLIYICNPNNPTASITPKDDMRRFIEKVPPQTIVLVDEAYFHYADSPDYESVIPLIKDHPNLIVARTFSKIYGMAGLRCGYCITQKETLQRMRPHLSWDSVNILAMAAAIASLNDPDQVANSRRLNKQTRQFVSDEVTKLGYQQIPSEANFMMIDLKQPVRPVIDGLRQRNVQVGRVFSSLPNHLRVTIGKQSEMETFLNAFRETLSTSSSRTADNL
jgi:histidinol-phosphate aminotransferase